jgi:lysophospholipid acyltransferase
MYYSYMDWHLDFTRPQMIITIKLTTLAFNLSDAKHRVEEVPPPVHPLLSTVLRTAFAHHGPKVAHQLQFGMFVVRTSQELSAHEKEKQVKEMPSVLEFLGYIYFFPSFLAGPHIYFADYKRYIRTHRERTQPQSPSPCAPCP